MRAKHWLFVIVLLVLPLATAATFTCTIRAATSCNADEALVIRLNSSEAGEAPNNSHAQMPNSTADAYPYSLCCATDAFRTLVNTCSATSTDVLKLYNHTDSHVQAGTQSGYAYTACLNVTAGNITCEYPNDACSAGYSQVVSIASSEAADSNLTNAHVAEFGLYKRKVCCQVGGQNPPVVAFANVTPNPTATTRDDLLCANGSVTDADGDAVTLHYNWYRNGTSITVLNLPMDYDSDTGTTHDISGSNNHGTVNGATFLPTGGKVGGAYSFDRIDDSITFANSSSLNPGTGEFSISAWVKTTNDAVIIDKLNGSSDGKGYRLEIVGGGSAVFTIGNSSTTTNVVNSPGTNFDSFKYVVATKNATHINVYINGAPSDDGPTPVLAGSLSGNTTPTIGALATGEYKGGTIDEVIIFNRSLTAAEIQALYNSYNYNLSGTELRRNDFWNCSITPIDSTGLNGTTKFSNQTNISGSPPLAVTLTYPADGNTSVFERYVNFDWTTADERDNDQVNYTLNTSVEPGACSFQGTASDFQTSNYTYGELCTDQYYNWTVQACDIDGCSSVSAKFNFTIASVLSITLLNNNTNFGTLLAGQSIQTNDSVAPFLLENNGNVLANITVNATNSPFTLAALGTDAFQYKARANESEAYNASGSQTTYTPVDAIVKNVLKQLNYTDANDAAYIDINITVPLGEPPGSKTTNVTFRAQVTS